MNINSLKNSLKTYKHSNNRGIINQISVHTGIHVSQVSRILNGQFKQITPSVIKICKFANLQTEPKQTKPSKPSPKLSEAIIDVWDGSKEVEELLYNVIYSIKPTVSKHKITP